jgi:hypothetical protein
LPAAKDAETVKTGVDAVVTIIGQLSWATNPAAGPGWYGGVSGA